MRRLAVPHENRVCPAQAFRALLVSAMLLPRIACADGFDPKAWWNQATDRVATIYGTGTLDLYLSGYAYHGRGTYSPEKIASFNETIWGAGLGKSLRTARGNDEALYAMAIADSHDKPQFMAGYVYQWMWAAPATNLEAGAGFTLSLVSRQDYFGGFPFPVVLPVASAGTRMVKVTLSYIPRLSENKGNGDVLLAFLRWQLP